MLAWVLATCLQSQTCASCHEKERRAEQGSVHAGACADCHATERTARADVPALCARCHSDPRRMNPTGLPTDQHAQFLTSKHGETGTAVCTDCHGAHGIRRARDPLSPVHASRVPATCGTCHRQPSDAEALWRSSAHGKAGLPHCATCHGNHGAVPPGFAEVGLVCGKCHVPEREHFAKSPHAFYTGDKGFKECVTCHANHAIVRGAAEVAGRCAPCHEPKDKEMAAWTSLQGRVESARARFRRTADRLAEMTRAGFPTDEDQLSLEEVRTSLLQLAPLQHTLSLEKVGAAAADLGGDLDRIDGRLDGQERAERLKKLALVPVWAFLVALAWVFRAKMKEVARGRA